MLSNQTQAHPLAIEMAKGSSSALHLMKTLDLVSRFDLTGKSVLDFGAGSGTLLSAFAAQGFSGVGIDALSRPPHLSSSIDWKVGDLNSSLPSDLQGKYDLACAIEVVEHLENPRQAVRSLYSSLKPGGLAILSSPNVLSLRSLISLFVRGHFVDFLNSSYPAHITPVLPMDMERMLKEAGFDDVQIHFSNRGSLPALTSLTWQTLSLGLLKGLRFSDHWFVTAQKPNR